MKTIKAKQLVATTNSPTWFGCKYNLNIYRGCSFGCIYCDSRSLVYKVDNFDEVKIKENITGLLEKELSSKRKTGVIGLGAMSDPYNVHEKDMMATRSALEIINKYKFGIHITTKSDLVTRDIDVLKKINEHSEVLVSLTITCDDDLAKKLEPRSPRPSSRYRAIKELSDAGLYVGITLMPLIPFLNDTEGNVLEIVEKAFRNGAKYIYPGFGVTQREGQMEYMYEKFDRHFPGLKNKFIKTFNYQYSCGRKTNLYDVFKKRCEHLGIITRMKDIVDESRKYIKEEQLSLF